VFKRNRFAWQPARQQGSRQRFQCRHIMPALLGDRGSLAFQLRLPGPGQPRITGTQGAVALAQGAVITPPVFVERMFHVEHTPIEKAAPYLRAIEQEPLAFGVDDLQGQVAGENRQATDILLVDPDFGPFVTTPYGKARLRLGQHGTNRQGIATVSYELLGAGGPERTNPGKKMNGLQQAGLAGGIATKNHIDASG